MDPQQEDFMELRSSASRGGYEGYGYTHSPGQALTHFPSRSPSPEGTGHHGQGLPSASVENNARSSGMKKGKKKKVEYELSHSLSLGIRKPSTAPAGTLIRKQAPKPGEDGYLPFFHFGTGNTGKNTAKKSSVLATRCYIKHSIILRHPIKIREKSHPEFTNTITISIRI